MLDDAFAVLCIISREGLGKARHLDTNHSWTQGVAVLKKATFQNVHGTDNCADLMAKEFGENEIYTRMDVTGAKFQQGRAETAASTTEDAGRYRSDADDSKVIRVRPGEAPLIAQWSVIANFADWPGKQREDEKKTVNGESNHFKLRRQNGEVRFAVDGRGFVIGK